MWRQDSATAPDPHRPGQQSREHRVIAVWMNEAIKLVFSRTLTEVTWNDARLVRELDVDAMAAMKKQPGKDMMIFGSGSIVSQLTQYHLIDEYPFVVCPVFLGHGLRLLEGLSTGVALELLEARREFAREPEAPLRDRSHASSAAPPGKVAPCPVTPAFRVRSY